MLFLRFINAVKRSRCASFVICSVCTFGRLGVSSHGNGIIAFGSALPRMCGCIVAHEAQRSDSQRLCS